MDNQIPKQPVEAPPPAGLQNFAATINKPEESSSSGKKDSDAKKETTSPDGNEPEKNGPPQGDGNAVKKQGAEGGAGDGTAGDGEAGDAKTARQAVIDKLGQPLNWKTPGAFPDESVFNNLNTDKLFSKNNQSFDASPGKPNTGDGTVKQDGKQPVVDAAVKQDGKQTAGDTTAKPDGKPEAKADEKAKESLSSYLGKAISGVTEIPKAVAKAGDVTSWMPNMGKVLGGGDGGKDVDPATEKIAKEKAANDKTNGIAEKGKAKLDAENEQYLKQWKPTPAAPKLDADAKPGEVRTHDAPGGGKFTTKDGHMDSFTTAQGQKYSGVEFKDGQLSKYTNQYGQTHTRLTAPDKNGFATWGATDKNGRPVNFEGAGSSQWLGKPEITEKGMDHLIGSGQYTGWKYSRGMDGTHTASRPEYKNGKFSGLDSTTTSPEGDQVTRHSSYENGKLIPDNSKVGVNETDGSKSKVKFDQAGKPEVVESKRPKEGSDFLSHLDNMSKEMKDAIKNFERIKVSDSTKNPGFTHIEGTMKNAIHSKPPAIEVGGFGPRGRVAAQPVENTIQRKFDVDVKASDGLLQAKDAHGFTGTAHLTRYGKFFTQDLGYRPTSTSGYTLDTRSGTPVLTSHGVKDVPLTAGDFPPGSKNAELLKDKATTDALIDTVKQADGILKSADIRQTSPGVFEGNVNFGDKLAVNQKIPGKLGMPDMTATNLYFKDGKGADMKWNVDTGKMEIKGNMEVGLKMGDGKEMRMPVSKLVREVGPDGKASFRPEFGAPADNKPAAPKQAANDKPAVKTDKPVVKTDKPVQTDKPAPTDKPVQNKPKADKPTQYDVKPPVGDKPPTRPDVEQPDAKPKSEDVKPKTEDVKPKPEDKPAPPKPSNPNQFKPNCNYHYSPRRGLFRRH